MKGSKAYLQFTFRLTPFLTHLCDLLLELWYSVVRCQGIKTSSFQVRVVANTDYLAQASWPRLGEMSIGSPRVFYASRCSGDQTLVLSEQTSRLGGEGLT
ncbi:hypothetical protein DEO72_LG10g2234 [Vigna unguiculata]|uniref:Uncharacterized protein n=1 Tax=Vigna unguiculata TaxID=3917 RepID=A0A4D6NDQ6_VIGUN|nr:hypothetical protein DEO72_LG10g2234 [Vigna unguiculata]